MKKQPLNYSALLISIVLIATPLSSQSDTRKGYMMDDDMMEYRGRHNENYMPMGRMGHKSMKGGGMMRGGMKHGRRTRINIIGMLDLDSKQRSELRGMQREHRNLRWQTMGKMMVEKDKLFDLYNTENRDKEAIVKVYSNIFSLKKQIIGANIDAGNKARGILTKKQRKELDDKEARMRRRSYMGGMMGGMGGMMGR